MYTEFKAKLKACLDDRLLNSKKELCIKEAEASLLGTGTVCGANVLISTDSADMSEVDQEIVNWANTNSVNLVIIEDGDPSYMQHDHVSMGNIHNIGLIDVSKEQFEILNTPNTVLYFRRIDQMRDKTVRRYLLDFMRTNWATVGDGKAYFAKNVLFAIATISNEMDRYEKYELCTVDAKDAFLFKIK
jgi:hypothetical protein